MNYLSDHPAEMRAPQAIAFGTIVFACLVYAEPAFAQSSGAFAPLETAVQMIVDFITSRSVAGDHRGDRTWLPCLRGAPSWFTAGAVVLGIGLVFGAPAIVDEMIAAVGN